MISDDDLKFSNIWNKLIGEWPADIELNLRNYDSNSGRYAVDGLGVLADKLGDAYIGVDEEVVFRNFHWAVNCVIWAAAKSITNLNLSDLCQSSVKENFDRILKEALSDESGWSACDKELIERYFSVNSNDVI